MSRHSKNARIVLLGAALLAGCSFHDVKGDPQPRVEVPESFGAAPADAAPEAVRPADRWWTDFGDAKLDTLVDGVLAGNLDLAQAWARLDQALALSDQAESAYWPQVQAEVGVTHSQSQIFLGKDVPIGDGGSKKVISTVYPMSVGASYEIDLWGRVGHLTSAAELDILAGREDIEALAMTMVAQVVELYFSIAEQKAQLALIAAQDSLNSTYLELIQLRFQQGAATALDVFQQKQQTAAVQGQKPLVEMRLDLYRHQLAVLLGKPPSAELPPLADALPALPPLPDAGVPVGLLERRPDVQAAKLRVVAADHRVGAAIADRFPALRLSGSTGFQDREITSLFTNWVFNLAANLVAPLFDGFRRAAEVERQRAVVEEKVHGYGKTVLTAFKEVEDALVQEQQQRRYLDELDRQLELASSTLDEAKARFSAGLTDYLPVLGALRTLQQTELNRVSAARQLVSYRVQLYRALGGTWTDDLKRDGSLASRTPPRGEAP